MSTGIFIQHSNSGLLISALETPRKKSTRHTHEHWFGHTNHGRPTSYLGTVDLISSRRWCAVTHESRVEPGAGGTEVALRVRQAVRGCALERNPDAAARSVFNDLFAGLVVKVVVPQAATERSQGGEAGG